MKKEIVITGVAGFIGYSLAKRLLDLGYTVIGIDNSFKEKIKNDRLNILSYYGDQFVLHDINIENSDILSKTLSEYNPEKIIHLAGNSGKPNISYIHSNFIGFSNILDFSAKNEIPFIYASTHAVYQEDGNSACSEKSAVTESISVSATLAKSNELLAYSYSSLFNLPTIGLRFFSVYGPWGNSYSVDQKFTSSILQDEPIQIYSKEDISRDFIYIDDAVDGILGAIKQDMSSYKNPFEIFNIGSGKSTSLKVLINFIELYGDKEATVKLLPSRLGDTQYSCADITKSKDILGLNPKIDIADGLRTLVEWVRVRSVKDKK